jgi:hypothetical protein
MSLTDLIEVWLQSRNATGWQISRFDAPFLPSPCCSYIMCRDHTWPMNAGDDYIMAVFDDHIVPFSSYTIPLYATDPEFLNKLSDILNDHNNRYHI